MNMERTQLNSKVSFYICESFKQELEIVTKKYTNINIIPYKGKCKYHHMQNPFTDFEYPEGENYILGGCCVSLKNALPKEKQLSIKENCFYMLAPKSLVNHYIKNHGYIVTPGWVEDWQKYVKKIWGFDEATARKFFSEFCKKIIFLDTLKNPKSLQQLQDFSRFIDIPFETIPIGLEYFQLFIDNILEKKALQNQMQNQKLQLKNAIKKVADYSMTFDILSNINKQLDEKQIINKIIELFSILFAPEKITYLSIKNSKVIDELSSLHVTLKIKKKLLALDTPYSLEKDGFILKLSYDEETIGILQLEKIAFKEYIKEYVNLSLDIVNILCASIINSRNLIKQQELQIQLLQQEKHASMGEIISMIAHQWRQPLTAINMRVNNILIDIELGDVHTEAFQEELHHILSYTKGLSHTIDDFREFFKPTKIKEEVFAKELLNNTLKIFTQVLKNDNIEVMTNYKEKIKIKTYSREIMQVFNNIIKNAHEALMDSEIEKKRISIDIEDIENKKRIRISNNGKHIPEDILEKLFDPYFSTKTSLNGTGLGLYMSRTIIAKHLNGSIECYNLENGVCFDILIPYK